MDANNTVFQGVCVSCNRTNTLEEALCTCRGCGACICDICADECQCDDFNWCQDCAAGHLRVCASCNGSFCGDCICPQGCAEHCTCRHAHVSQNLVSDIQGEWKKHPGSLGANLISPILDEGSIHIHVECVVWRGIDVAAVSLGPIWYVGQTTVTSGNKWRPTSNFYRLVKTCSVVFPRYKTRDLYLRTYLFLDFDTSENKIRNACVMSRAPCGLTARASSAPNVSVFYVHTVSPSNTFDYSADLKLRPKERKNWTTLDGDLVTRNFEACISYKTQPYHFVEFFFNGHMEHRQRVADRINNLTEPLPPYAECSRNHGGPEPATVISPDRDLVLDDLLQRIPEEDRSFLEALNALLDEYGY